MRHLIEVQCWKQVFSVIFLYGAHLDSKVNTDVLIFSLCLEQVKIQQNCRYGYYYA